MGEKSNSDQSKGARLWDQSKAFGFKLFLLALSAPRRGCPSTRRGCPSTPRGVPRQAGTVAFELAFATVHLFASD